MSELAMNINMTPTAAAVIASHVAAAVAAEMEKHFTVEPTLTLAEAAEQLHLSQTVMRQLCREKKLPAIKLDKSYRIRVVDINRYLDERTIPAERNVE